MDLGQTAEVGGFVHGLGFGSIPGLGGLLHGHEGNSRCLSTIEMW